MTQLTITTIDSIQGFLEKVDRGQNGDLNSLWFRGVGNSAYDLAPSLHRHPGISDTASLFSFEQRLITRFKERSVPYLTNRIDDIWEWLFLMQHYGMPTRLLDWTENPFIALFFALSSARKSGGNVYTDDAAVWIMSPSTWNQTIFRHQSYSGSAFSPTDTSISSYTPGTDPRYVNDNPVAILGIHNSPRIVAQRGSFCLFGKSLDPMEKIFEAIEFPANALEKLVIPAVKIEELLQKLLWMGISDSVVYPDLEGLARETKRLLGFGV
jgi:hypothetical protein